MASDTSTVAFIYKSVYSDDAVGEQTMREHVLLAKSRKKYCPFGDDFNYIVRYGNPQGISGTFANAQTNSATSKGKKFVTDSITKYGVIDLDGPSMAKAENNKAAFYDLVTMETDGVIEGVGDSFGHDIYGAGDGQLGQRSSISGDVVTLANAEDARNFHVGMTVLASANANGSTPRVGTTTVIGKNEDAGTVTLDDETDIAEFANSDYLFRDGDVAACVDGLADLIPLAAPDSTAFRSVDRTPDIRRLAGVRIDNSSVYPEENLGLLAVKVNQGGKRSDQAFVNPLTMWQMSRRLDAKVQFDDAGGKATYGFEFITIATPGGRLRVYPDPDCPSNRAYVGKEGKFEMRHAKKQFIHVIRDDGRPSMRKTTTDGIEVRIRSICQTAIPTPGEWGVCSVA